jgi:lactate dehydrogenase-like 2-hydroxyacid dehydrogenase
MDWGKVYAHVRAVYHLDVADLTYAQLLALLENLPETVDLIRGL